LFLIRETTNKLIRNRPSSAASQITFFHRLCWRWTGFSRKKYS